MHDLRDRHDTSAGAGGAGRPWTTPGVAFVHGPDRPRSRGFRRSRVATSCGGSRVPQAARAWLRLAVVAAVSLAAGGAPAAPLSGARPDIVLLMGDDHGWDETGYNGHPWIATPVLDEMARTGLRLDRFYSGGPSCSPTRATIITGRHHLRSGVFAPGWSLERGAIGIGGLLREAGYATGHFGKWHLGPVKAASPTNPGALGFETWVSHDNFFELDPVLSRDGAAPETFPGEGSDVCVTEAIRFIDRARAVGHPFLAVIWFGSPHEPYQALPDDLARYDGLPAALADRQVRLTSNETGRQVDRPQRDVLRERFAEITAMDRAIGRLRAHLAAIGARDDTLLWYCGDNGTPPEAVATVPFRGHKGQVYEGGVRVPGIIEWPARIRTPRVSDMITVTTDTLPTLCELAGVAPPPGELDGVSLVPLLAGTMPARTRPVVFWNARPRPGLAPSIEPELQRGTTPTAKRGPDGAFTRGFSNLVQPDVAERDFGGDRAILDDPLKLVLDAAGPGSVELFDVRADPAEATNLAAARPADVARLTAALRAWQQSVLESLVAAGRGERR